MQTCQVNRQRRDIGKRCEENERRAFELIMTKEGNLKQALRPDAVPVNVAKENVVRFIDAASEALSRNDMAKQELWRQMIDKYDLPVDQNNYVDLRTGEFYVIEEST